MILLAKMAQQFQFQALAISIVFFSLRMAISFNLAQKVEQTISPSTNKFAGNMRSNVQIELERSFQQRREKKGILQKFP